MNKKLSYYHTYDQRTKIKFENGPRNDEERREKNNIPHREAIEELIYLS